MGVEKQNQSDLSNQSLCRNGTSFLCQCIAFCRNDLLLIIDCYYRYVSQSLKEKTDQMESTNKQYVLEKVSLNMFFSIFALLPTSDFVAQSVVAPY